MQQNRLTVLGQPRPVSAFANSHWFNAGRFRSYELLENSSTRYACQFESMTDPLPYFIRLSRRRPDLTFLLEYERARLKGLAKVRNGKITRHEIHY
jgi:hypothetical protein